MPHLDLSDDEADALATVLSRTIDGDRVPLSPRVLTLKAILAKLRAEPAQPAASPEPTVLCAAIEGTIPTPRVGRMMWGYPIQFWQAVASWAEIVALVCAVLTGAALFISSQVSSHVADVVKRDADTRIAEASVEAAKANEEAAKANERAVGLEKDAAQLRLDLEKEREKRLGRSLSKEQFDALHELKGKISKVNVRWESNIEVMAFGHQIVNALMQAGLDPKIYFAPADNKWTGIIIWSAKSEGDPLMDAFTKAGLLPAWANIAAMAYPDVPRNAPLIEIGERFPEMKAPYFGPPRINP